MARSRETKIELTAYDDLFQTDESREEEKLSKIRDIPISEIDEFPDHPFKVLMDEDIEQLVESIKRNGVMTPATVRLKEDGRYELISGHRRKKACELAGLETLKCEVKELTRDEAIIVMVESNLQRSVILPSEKAFAYKMRLEAMKRQAGRPPKENASPLATNLSKGRSDEELGELVGESKDQIRRYIRLEKSGEVFSSVAGDKGLYQPIFSVSGLEGAVYEITAAEDIVTLDGTVRANKGEVVDTVTTGKDGTVKSKELYLGKYEVKEITAPYGMVLNEEVRSVELVYAGQNVDVTETATSFYNERQRVEIDLIKSLAIDEAYSIGKNGEIFDVTFGLYAAEELTAADGKTIPADGLIEVISLDESGHGKAISDLPMGSYYVQEISTNSAYIVSDAKYPVTFEYAGQDTETVRITANEGEAITNDIIYGSVSGKKSDEDGKVLGGAVIGIFTTGTTEFTKENAIAATTSKDDGSFSFAKVPYGTWIIREIESPKGYVLSEEEITVTIGKVDEVVEIELVNYFIKGNIALTKVDEDYPDNKLSGAVFEVYSDTNGDGKLDKDDTLLGEMKELDGGVYQMSELRYGKYLVKETKAPTGFVLDENVYSVSVEENGKTYTVENKAGVGFINAAQKGSLKIVKTSSDGKVEGFSFRVTGVDYDQTFKTDKNGEIVIEGLRIGDYTVSEVSDKASAGYILPADKQATVKVDATAIVQMHNEFRDTPKTGDDFNLGLWVSLAALSVVGAGVLGFVGYKNRKKKKED